MSSIEESEPSLKGAVNAETATVSSGQQAEERAEVGEYLQRALSLDEQEIEELRAMDDEGPRTPTNSVAAGESGSEPSAEALAAAQSSVLASPACGGDQRQLPHMTDGPVATDTACRTSVVSERRRSIFSTAPLPAGLVVVLLVGIIAAFAYAIIFRGGRLSGQKQIYPVSTNDTARVFG